MEDTLPPVAGAPVCEKGWAALSSSKMMRSRNQCSDVLTRLQLYEAGEAAARGAALEQAAQEKEAAKEKARRRVKKHQVVIDNSQKCIRAIEEAMQRLEDTLSRTTHERYARFADSQVNERRSDLRSRRPERETFKDQLQANLGRERDTLASSRKDLLDREAEVKTFLQALASLRVKLSHDTGARRLQVEHELTLLRPSLPPSLPLALGPGAAPSASATAEAAEEAASPASPTTEAGPASPSQARSAEEPAPPLEGPEVMAHINKTNEFLQKVGDCCERSQKAIIKSRTSGRFVSDQVEKSLARRSIELCAMKKNIEMHIGDTTYAIMEAERGLEKHLKRLSPADTEKAHKLQGAKDVLNSLKTTKTQLVEDLRGKIEALNLDNSCRRVTPAAAAAEVKQAARTLKHANSAPSLNATLSVDVEAAHDERRSSAAPTPLGGSSTLRAAAAASLSVGAAAG